MQCTSNINRKKRRRSSKYSSHHRQKQHVGQTYLTMFYDMCMCICRFFSSPSTHSPLFYSFHLCDVEMSEIRGVLVQLNLLSLLLSLCLCTMHITRLLVCQPYQLYVGYLALMGWHDMVKFRYKVNSAQYRNPFTESIRQNIHRAMVNYRQTHRSAFNVVAIVDLEMQKSTSIMFVRGHSACVAIATECTKKKWTRPIIENAKWEECGCAAHQTQTRERLKNHQLTHSFCQYKQCILNGRSWCALSITAKNIQYTTQFSNSLCWFLPVFCVCESRFCKLL